MTSVAADVTVTDQNTGVPDGPIPDDLLSEALTAAAERNSRFLPDDPNPAPEPTAVADKPADGTEAGTAPPAGEGALPTPADPNAPAAADKPGEVAWETQWAALVKDAAPLAYRQNGTERVFDHILEVPGKGGFIAADKLDEVRNLVARHESNAAAVKELYSYKQDVEGLGGTAKIHELTEANAQLDAAAVLILEALRNPQNLVMVDEHGRIVPNQERVNFLIERAGTAAERAQFAARRESQKAATEAAQRTAQTDAEAQVRATALPTAMAQFRAAYPTLTPADFTEAEQVFGPLVNALVFQVTPEQAQQWRMTPGQFAVDLPKMEPWFQARAAMRTTQAAEAKARTQAERENAARQPAPKVLPRKTVPVQPRDADGKFVAPKRTDASTIFERAMAGKPISGAEDYDL